MIALAVIAAGAVGALVRYLVSRAFAGSQFPWAVLVVNVAGSAIGGAVLGLATRAELSADLRLVLLTGLCGGLTTFSTLSVETVQLVLEGRTRAAVSSITTNLVLGIGAAALACCLVLLG
ncbi:MAG: CrcB family protein [Rhodoglobus sp.]|nr:CrcB family protein [Rhodoglobus sp.]